MTTRNVLIAYDNSDCSDYTIQWVLDNNILQKTDQIAIASVINENPERIFDALSMDAAVYAGGQLLANEYMERLEALQRNTAEIIKAAQNKLKDFNTTGTVLTGSQSGEALVDYAQKKDINFIIMGSRGLGWFKRQLIGSVSDHVIHHSKCPLLIVKHSEKQLKQEIEEKEK